eukprot:6477765-Amphidinium_carterae.1
MGIVVLYKIINKTATSTKFTQQKTKYVTVCNYLCSHVGSAGKLLMCECDCNRARALSCDYVLIRRTLAHWKEVGDDVPLDGEIVCQERMLVYALFSWEKRLLTSLSSTTTKPVQTTKRTPRTSSVSIANAYNCATNFKSVHMLRVLGCRVQG